MAEATATAFETEAHDEDGIPPIKWKVMDPAESLHGLMAMTDLFSPPQVHVYEMRAWHTTKVVIVRVGPRRLYLFGSPAALRALLDQADERNPYMVLPEHVVIHSAASCRHHRMATQYPEAVPPVIFDVREPERYYPGGGLTVWVHEQGAGPP